MCEVLDRIENRGIAKGREEGVREGITEMLRKYMNKHDCNADEAMDEFDISLSDRETLRAMLD